MYPIAKEGQGHMVEFLTEGAKRGIDIDSRGSNGDSRRRGTLISTAGVVMGMADREGR